jgi:topoisomerase-4 subunit B
MSDTTYDESNYKKLEFPESIRTRPGMYVGNLGNGKSLEDGMYILIKEALDNSTDEYHMGHGTRVLMELERKESCETIRITDEGRGIPLGVVKECASEVHGGAKFDSKAFQTSAGMNGVGIKAVNALSQEFILESRREGKFRRVTFARGVLKQDETGETKAAKGTTICFTPDTTLFPNYSFQTEFLEKMAFQCACMYPNLEVVLRIQEKEGLTEKTFFSKDGLIDFLRKSIKESDGEDKLIYPIISLKGENIEVCLTHGQHYGEEIFSFVNGQYTHQGGTHVSALREGLVSTIREFTKKNFETADIRGSLLALINIRIQEPSFDSQIKTKLVSTHTQPQTQGATLKTFVGDFLRKNLDDFLHKNPEVAKKLEAKIVQNETERKELSGIKDKARELTKRASLANRKLKDCRVHYDDIKHPKKSKTTLFITEGDSASGSVTFARDNETQAVFSLKGKPVNCYGKTKRVIYENEELHLLQSALGIEHGMENLRYNQIVIATDADQDGMHIRLLLTTFFLRYYPELIKEGHVYILQTPLFRVRNKKETKYCYSPEEFEAAKQTLGPQPEITRFKGLGEISPNEFKNFIGENIRLEAVVLDKEHPIEETLKFFMGNNTPERQVFFCENLISIED